MKVLLYDIGEIDCTPAEFAELQELGALMNLRHGRGADHGSTAGSHTPNGSNGTPVKAVVLSGAYETASQKNATVNDLNEELFFRKCTQAMARIMLAYITHSGKVSLAELLTETGLGDGRSLRKPNGALSDRIRAASLNRIREFHTAQQITNEAQGRSERIYTVAPAVLEFLRANEARIATLANKER